LNPNQGLIAAEKTLRDIAERSRETIKSDDYTNAK
jgi:hypothetical protein